MRRVFLILPAVLVVGAIGGWGGCAKDNLPPVVNLDTLITDGWALYKEGRFKEAFAKFDSAILYVDPADIEAHLGKGLSLLRLGDFSKAHEEFALIYSPYVQENLKVLNLYVPDNREDTIGGSVPSPYIVGKRAGLLPSTETYSLAAWKMGRIFRDNGVGFEDASAVYLPVDVLSLVVDPVSDDPKSIDPGTYITAFMPITVPLRMDGGELSYVDTLEGPIIFTAGAVSGIGEAPLLVDWMYDGIDDTIRINLLTLKINKTGLGEHSDIVWMAIAADAYAYYLDPSNTHKRQGAYMAYVAYMLFPWRGDVPDSKGYSNIRGLTEDDSTVLNGLLGMAALGYYRDKLVGNAVTLIRLHGDNTFPSPDWTYFPTNNTEMTWSVGYTKDKTYNSEVYSKVNALFFGR